LKSLFELTISLLYSLKALLSLNFKEKHLKVFVGKVFSKTKYKKPTTFFSDKCLLFLYCKGFEPNKQAADLLKFILLLSQSL
jgi:hypothetical protein